MAETKLEKPPIVQQFDKYIDREYYKITPGFFCSSEKKIRTDSFKDINILQIEIDQMPDKVYVNGVEYKLEEVIK